MKNIGMVGVGDISGIYLENITKRFKEIKLVAVCDIVKSKAENAQQKYGVPKLYDTMHEMFADPEIDIILNLTRPYEHHAVTKAALLAGKHVYSEKPLGASLAEGRELVALAEANGLMIGGAPDTVLGAGIQTCRKLIDDGMIGTPHGAAAFMMCRGHETWHPDPAFYYQYGGGPMLDMGPYYVTALVNLLGGVRAVTGIARKTFDTRLITSQPRAGTIVDVEVPTHITGMMEMENGALASLTTTFDVVYDGQARFEVYGSDGTLFVPDPNCFGGPVVLLRREEGVRREIPLLFDYRENSRGVGLADMAKAIETGRAPRVSYKQMLHVLEVMEAFGTSSEKQARHEISSTYTRAAPMQNNLLHGVLD